MDPEVQSMLAEKSDAERYCAVAYAFACLLTGPVPFQAPEYNIFPDYDDDSDDDEEEKLEVEEASPTATTEVQDSESKAKDNDEEKTSV